MNAVAAANRQSTYLLFADLTPEQEMRVAGLLPCALPMGWDRPLPDKTVVNGLPAVIWSTKAQGRIAAKIAQELFSSGCTRVSIVPEAPDLHDYPYPDDLIQRARPIAVPDAGVPRETARKKKQPGSEVIPGTDTPAYVLWEKLELARNERGPYATEANALRILCSHQNYAKRIWLDEFSQRLMITDPDNTHRQFHKNDGLAALAWMQEALQLPKMGITAVTHAALLLGDRDKRHPIRDYLDGLQWDKRPRLPTLMADAFGAAQNDYTAAVGRCWFVAMVARIYQPGCKFDNAVVFEGAQGLKKSSALSIIGGSWFLESAINPSKHQKDFLLSLQGKWIVEIPEFDRAGDITALLSIRNDTYRVPYGATSMDYPRQCCFVGTTNFETYSDDPSGARRLWGIYCGAIELDYLRENRDQLFAEAVARYRMGEAWWDVPADLAREEQSQRRTVDEWEGEILRFLDEDPTCWEDRTVTWARRREPLQQVTVSEVLSKALQLPPRDWTQVNQNRVARCLKAIGLTKSTARVNDSKFPIRVWRR